MNVNKNFTTENESFSRLPVHIAIIMDGNGRWALKRGLPRSFGHRAGVENVRTVIKTSSDIGIKMLTLYAFSTENWKRPKDEVNVLMDLLVEFMKSKLNELHENNVKINAIGDLSKLPERVQAEIKRTMALTKDNTGLIVNMALNYGGRAELVEAVRHIVVEQPDKITEQTISEHLYTAGMPDPDIIIRTSGETRLSNFLLYQCAYSELVFTDTLWPDFDKVEYLSILKRYENADRRYGAV